MQWKTGIQLWSGHSCCKYQVWKVKNRYCSSTGQYHVYSEAWWWQCNASGMGRLVRIEGIQTILRGSPGYLKLGWRFIAQRDKDAKHAPTITLEWIRDMTPNDLVWPSQSPEVNPIRYLWRDLKITVHRCTPSNLTEKKKKNAFFVCLFCFMIMVCKWSNSLTCYSSPVHHPCIYQIFGKHLKLKKWSCKLATVSKQYSFSYCLPSSIWHSFTLAVSVLFCFILPGQYTTNPSANRNQLI